MTTYVTTSVEKVDDRLILPFDTINHADLAHVGGKGANLGELTQAGFNVPTGFCVSTHAFARFMAGVAEDIYADLNDIASDNLAQLRTVGNHVRSALAEYPLPDDVEEAVRQAWTISGKEHAYAVRSSATAEDLPGASFAGQQDTYLNIRGIDALLSSVKNCFISLFTDRAILYRIQNGFDHQAVALSVVVQRMVQPDVSGILFTADPVTGNRHIISIDASFGLGEALVSGIVSADLYQVDKRTDEIVKRQIASKEIAIRSLAEGGVEQVDLSIEEQTQAALTDAQVRALAKLGTQIEAHYGTPQDIEWALVNDVLYITQSRPITSLYPLPSPTPEDDALHVYVSLSHAQVMTDIMSPLSISLLRTVLPVGHAGGQLESAYIHSAGGRFYGDLSLVLRHPITRRILPRAMENMDTVMASILQEFVKRPDFQSRGERLQLSGVLPHILPTMRKVWVFCCLPSLRGFQTTNVR
ncbi:MAG: PEP/pyruvate-binding domain-containing protein [Bacteroidota bacterium]